MKSFTYSRRHGKKSSKPDYRAIKEEREELKDLKRIRKAFKAEEQAELNRMADVIAYEAYQSF